MLDLGTSLPVEIHFKDLQVEARVNNDGRGPMAAVKRKLCGTKVAMETKRLLTNVSGSVVPGCLAAIIGPSGSGKSILLNALAGSAPLVQGEVKWNGEDFNRDFQMASGFVQQEDLFFAHLTVEEHLMYLAELRLDVIASERTRIVDSVIKELGLSRCRQSLIGAQATGGTRGISGGERKRVAIASELIRNPSVLFLDAPTTGLDAFMAAQVVEMLKSLARQGRTVVTTIQQPSSDVFQMFDWLFLLAEGQLVYSGPVTCVMEYFASIGYQCDLDSNPCDYLMDILVAPPGDEAGAKRVLDLISHWNQYTPTWATPKALVTENQQLVESLLKGESFVQRLNSTSVQQLLQSFDEQMLFNDEEATHNKDVPAVQISLVDENFEPVSPNQRQGTVTALVAIRCLEEPHSAVTAPPTTETLNDAPALMPTTSKSNNHVKVIEGVPRRMSSSLWLRKTSKAQYKDPTVLQQVYTLSRKHLSIIIRDPEQFRVRLMQSVMFGVFLGLMYWRIEPNERSVTNRLGAIFFILMNLFMTNFVSVLQSFPEERSTVRRDVDMGLCQPTAYYAVKTLVDFPLQILYPVLFTCIAYWVIGLNDDAEAFFVSLFTVVLHTNLAFSCAYAFSSIVPSTQVGTNLLSPFVYPSVILSGYVLNPRLVKIGWKWLEALSVFRYSFRAFVIGVFNANFSDLPPCTAQICFKSSQDVLDIYDFKAGTYWQDWLVIVAFITMYRLLGLLATYWMLSKAPRIFLSKEEKAKYGYKEKTA